MTLPLACKCDLDQSGKRLFQIGIGHVSASWKPNTPPAHTRSHKASSAGGLHYS